MHYNWFIVFALIIIHVGKLRQTHPGRALMRNSFLAEKYNVPFPARQKQERQIRSLELPNSTNVHLSVTVIFFKSILHVETSSQWLIRVAAFTCQISCPPRSPLPLRIRLPKNLASSRTTLCPSYERYQVISALGEAGFLH